MIHISNRILRKTLFLMLAVIGTSSVSAQYYLNLYQKDGSNIKYKTSEIEKISITDRVRPNFNAEFVDLGLSVKWASCNLGAMTPTEFGMYYAWGETDTIVSSSQYKWYDNFTQKYSKYVLTEYYGKMDNKYRLDAEDDVANVYGGPDWRIPTDKEVKELVDSCYWTWTYVNGVAGYQVRSPKNGNSIFLPSAGVVWDSIPQSQGYSGYYLTNTLYTQYNSSFCNNLYFDELGFYLTNDNRNLGYTVRPVVSSKFDDNLVVATSLTINKKFISVEAGQQDSINAVYRLEKPELGVQLSWVSSNPAIAKVSSNGIVVGISAGQCVITAKIGSLTESCAVTVTASTAVKEAVDMGLSVRWATCNIGASKEEYVGSYYAWGETSGKTTYTWDNYKWMGKESNLTKYNDDDNLSTLQPDDDAAHIIWGDDWRMPTNAEFRELVSNCDITNDKKDGMPVVKFTSRINGGVIYFPLNGEFEGESWSSSPIGYVWTSNRNEDEVQQALSAFMLSLQFAGIINVSPNESENQFSTGRYVGLGIRPVKPYSVADIDSLMLDETEVELLVNKNYELAIKGRIPGSGAVAVSGVQWSSSDDKVATVKDGVITAKGEGTCVITASANNLTAECTVTVVDGSPEYVDLGLSVRWATFNVGAYKPEMAGDYYAWGETEPKTDYSWADYKYSNGSNNTLTKYCNYSNYGLDGFVDNKTVLDLEDDVAHVIWGDNWRTPSMEEFEELVNNCSWEWIEKNGVYGYKFTSCVGGFTDKSIFMPSVGYYSRTNIGYASQYGVYMSNELRFNNPSQARVFFSNSYDVYFTYGGDRTLGLPVRPVCNFDISAIDRIGFENDTLLLSLESSDFSLKVKLFDEYGRVIKVASSLNYNWTSDDLSVATVIDGIVHPVGEGSCTITVSYESHNAVCVVNVIDPSKVVPEGVDLGLSVKWATFNVGAFKPEMAGDYYAWGETEPKDDYSWSTYKYCGEASSLFTKYCSDSDNGFDGFVDYKTVLEPEDDVAHVLWGADWHIPSTKEFQELLLLCDWNSGVTLNGVEGISITGPNGNSIFLPSLGYYEGSTFYNPYGGEYLTSELDNDYDVYVVDYELWSINRCLGLMVRPVEPNDEWVGIDSITLSKSSVTIGLNEIVYLNDTLWSGNTNYNFFEYEVTWTSSDESVAIVEDGAIRGISTGEAVIRATYGGVYAECTVSVLSSNINYSATGFEGDYGYVDLGLSVKWATFNVGATSINSYGDYFAWGDTVTYYEEGYAQSHPADWKEGKTNGYTWSNYKYCAGSYNNLTKYCSINSSGYEGFTDGKIVLDPEDDVANVIWGDSWRMPTETELFELYNNCDWIRTCWLGVMGYRVTSKVSGYEDRSIFLPAAGYREREYMNAQNEIGYYWSSSVVSSEPSTAFNLSILSNRVSISSYSRYEGFSVRPVCPKE